MRRAVVIFTAGLMGCVTTTWAAEAQDSVREAGTKPPAAVETPAKMDLFVAGEDGYATYRIPGIVVTQRGTILAYCAARKDGIGDWADIDIALRRSLDGGRSWLPRQILVDAGKATADNPTAIGRPGPSTSCTRSTTPGASTCAATTTDRPPPLRST